MDFVGCSAPGAKTNGGLILATTTASTNADMPAAQTWPLYPMPCLLAWFNMFHVLPC